jgi:phosphonate transport system substrate-binding protein
MNRIMWMLLLCTGVFALAACGSGSSDGGTTTSGAPDKIVITAIPDDDATQMRENFGLIAKVIQDATGIPTEYVHVEDYPASVVAFATGNAHMAWFGAVTTGQAYIQMRESNQQMEIVACRNTDKVYTSYFIANADANIPTVNSLREIAEHANVGQWDFTFGSSGSTSSHLMPRSFFAEQSGKSANEAMNVFRNVAYSGSHDVVLEKVANGEFHIGALGPPAYKRASEEVRARAPIIYETPTFTNYCFAARSDMGPELIGKIRAALLDLHNTEEGRKALGYLKAERFIEADMSEWMSYVELIDGGVEVE